MGHGLYQVFTATITSGSTLSSEVDFGRSFDKVYIDPTGLASEVRIQAAFESGGTYRQIYKDQSLSSTVEANIFKVSSGISGGLQAIPSGFRFLKIETTAAIANGATCKIYCCDMGE